MLLKTLCLLTPRRLHRTTARWANSLQKAQKGRGNGSFFPIRKLILTRFTLQKSNFAALSPALQQRWWNSWNPWNECKPGPGRDIKPESHQAGEKAGVQFILWIYHSCEQEGTRETIHYAASASLVSGSQISAFSAGVRLGPWNLHPPRNSWYLNQLLMPPRFLSPKNKAALAFTRKLIYIIISVMIFIPNIWALMYDPAGAGLPSPSCVIPSGSARQHPNGPLHAGIQLKHWKAASPSTVPRQAQQFLPQLTRLRKQNEIWEQPSFSID